MSFEEDDLEDERHQNRAVQLLAGRCLLSSLEPVLSRHSVNIGPGIEGTVKSCQCMCAESYFFKSFFLNKYPYLHVSSGCAGGREGRKERRQEGREMFSLLDPGL